MCSTHSLKQVTAVFNICPSFPVRCMFMVQYTSFFSPFVKMHFSHDVPFSTECHWSHQHLNSAMYSLHSCYAACWSPCLVSTKCTGMEQNLMLADNNYCPVQMHHIIEQLCTSTPCLPCHEWHKRAMPCYRSGW